MGLCTLSGSSSKLVVLAEMSPNCGKIRILTGHRKGTFSELSEV